MSDYRTDTNNTLHLQVLLGAAAAFFMFSFVLAILPYQRLGFLFILLAQPGRFLFRSFHYAGVLVPMVLYVAVLSVRSPRFRLDWVVMSVLSIIPMGTAAIALRILFMADVYSSAITTSAVSVFGETLALAISATATIALMLMIYRMGAKLPPAASEAVVATAVSNSEVDRPEGLSNLQGLSTPRFNRLVLATERTAMNEEESAEEPAEEPAEESVEESVEEPQVEQMDDSTETTNQTVEDYEEEAVEQDPPVIQVTFPRRLAVFQESEQESEQESADEAESQPTSEQAAVSYPEEIPEQLFATTDPLNELQEVPVEIEADFDADEDEQIEDQDEQIEAQEQEENEEEERRREARILEESPPPKRITKGKYDVPIYGLLDHYENHNVGVVGPETRSAAQALKETLKEFNIDAEVTGIRKGPVITMFEILPAPGVKLAKITSLADNIALRLAAQSVRIVAPIPGKHAVGIEIPNHKRSLVSFGELLHDKSFKDSEVAIPLALGKDIPGDAQIVDLAKTPHLLIAGATGSGKSVCVNSIICSILYRRAPEEVRMILIDPKIVELKFYNDIPHLLTPVITDPKRAFQALQYAIYEMERRYSLLDAMGVRDISSYNRKIKDRKLATANLPYIVIVVDEFADLMATSGKELESTVARLCAMSRAVGIHLVLATQRPSTDVITGLIKANIPSRIAFMVASKVDSRIIIDTGGAEKLLGRGDMLFTSAWDPFPFRMQGAFLSEDEVERVVAHVKTLGEPDYIDDEIFIDDEEGDYIQPELEDPLMEKAVDIVMTANKASASYLQRRLKIGYNRAARLVEEMERMGIVGPQNGSKARDVIGSPQE